ncbi:hypothetical protein Q4Q39_06650 [Flavivirga amylovorans]|uniref:Fibronectin type-III domain-containing protein n=1 Tax=Flavivirga amylovorans TaxID=870486 RepID=A0ABT8WZH9_9FLAO|nr:hypothetical protein [Flavivirga amylovorans]MDO5987086.1 hypothetical protein [Flavivirga amylovorans]
MKKKIIHTIKILSINIIVPLLFFSCGGGSDEGESLEIPNPEAAVLIFPENNTECNEGQIINDNQSSVVFKWSVAANTDIYEVNLRNLNTSAVSKVNATANETPITIDRGTPYAWFVVSKASGTQVTEKSVEFRFYNEGPGVSNYAPFPAEAISPIQGAIVDVADSITLEWTTSDIDNDINEYEILFGTDAENLVSQGTTNATNKSNISIVPDTIYYWQILTTDIYGNTSNSDIFQFRVKAI